MGRGSSKLKIVGTGFVLWMIISGVNKNEAAAPGSTGKTAGEGMKVVNDTFVAVAPQATAMASNAATVGAELLHVVFEGFGQVGAGIAGGTGAAPAASDPRYQGG